jgi:hypothetical protein
MALLRLNSSFFFMVAGVGLLDSNLCNNKFGSCLKLSSFFIQRRFMYLSKTGFSNPASIYKIVTRPVSQFLMSKNPVKFLNKFVITSETSGKIIFETYSVVSLSRDINIEQGLDILNTQQIILESNLDFKSPLIKNYLQNSYVNNRGKIIAYLKTIDFEYREEALTAFTIGDFAHQGCSSASLMLDIKHFFCYLH